MASSTGSTACRADLGARCSARSAAARSACSPVSAGAAGSPTSATKIINDAKEKLKALCQEFDSKKKAFDGYCQAVQNGVDADYKAMSGLNQAAGGPVRQGRRSARRSTTAVKDGKKVDDLAAVAAAARTVAARRWRQPGGGGGGTPEIPKPENPLDKNGDGKPDVPGDTDGDGKVDDLDGDGKPDQPKPEEELESVTVKAGDNTIKVTEPDSNGHVKMTIDTPKGEPKTYDLDFSKNPEAAKALMGQNGAQAITNMANTLAGTTPSNPAQGSQMPGAPAPAARPRPVAALRLPPARWARSRTRSRSRSAPTARSTSSRTA